MGALVDFFRVLATAMNVVMFLSPIPTLRQIHRTKAVGHMPFIPLTAMVSNAHVWMVYGYLARNYVAIFSSCAFGVLASLCYVAVYYRYTTERLYAHKVMAVFALVIFVNSLYAILGANGHTGQSYEGVRKVVGYIADASSVVMYTSPFENIRQVFRHRSGVFIPITIVVVGSINSATWVIFSLLDIDWLVFAPNLFLLVVGLLQIAIYWVFHPSKHPLPVEAAMDGLPAITKDGGSRRSSVSFALSPTMCDPHKGGDDKDAYASDAPCFVALRSPLAPLHQV